jgi:hypothetical protein
MKENWTIWLIVHSIILLANLVAFMVVARAFLLMTRVVIGIGKRLQKLEENVTSSG